MRPTAGPWGGTERGEGQQSFGAQRTGQLRWGNNASDSDRLRLRKSFPYDLVLTGCVAKPFGSHGTGTADHHPSGNVRAFALCNTAVTGPTSHSPRRT